MYFGPLYIDVDAINRFFQEQSTWEIISQLTAMGGWLILAHLLFFAGLAMWVDWKESRYSEHWKWVLLAIDVPLLNLQTPKAVEQIFAHLAGAHDHVDIAKKFWHGHKDRHFSLEIVSIEGYIQFLIRTEETFRDLVEAAVYAQYPDAEITEVEDYASDAPGNFPNDAYSMWGADFTLTESDAYPIRTYKDFEHSISKDTQLKDPMAAFLESFTRIGPGEQLWFQILIQPTGNSWKEKVIAKVKEIVGDTSHAHHGGAGNKVLQFMADAPLKAIEFAGQQVFGGEEGAHADSHDDSGPPNKIQYLTPGESKLVEAMEEKISKIGFKTKMRGIYLARKEVFKVERAVSALIGSINQFNIPSANSLAPTYGVHVSYLGSNWRGNYRKRLLMNAYKKRKMKVGANPYILNIEELATIWHFPMSHIKTPSLQKIEGKRAEPPSTLPVERILPAVSELAENEKPAPPMRFG